MSPRGERHTALVTGASSGIGLEFARVLARHGHNLVLVARNCARLEEVAADLRSRHAVEVIVVATDLSVPGAAAALVSTLERDTIAIDLLVNNAGFSVYGPFAETPLSAELNMMQVNMVALTELTKLLVPAMMTRGFGRILNVGSTGSFSPGPLASVYCASKAFVLSFSEAIAEELRGTGVTVTALCPGPTATAFAERARMTETTIFRGATMSAEAVAAIGYRALMRGRTTVVAGYASKVLVFSMRFSPRRLVSRISKRLLSKAAGGLSAPAPLPTNGNARGDAAAPT